MLPSPRLGGSGRIYVAGVIACGFSVVAGSAYSLVSEPIGYQWLLLAALTLISGSATVRLPSVPASISISETFVFTAVLLYGPAAGTLIVALDGLVISFWLAKRRRGLYRAFFNMSAPAVSAWGSSQLFFLTAGIEPLVRAEASLDRLLPSLVLFAVTYFSLNSWLIAFAISFETKLSPFKVWRDNFLWLSLNYFCGASVAVLLVMYTREVDLRYIGVIIPLLLVLYFTFKTSMDRVADANRHVEQVNRLYLSTIETLAMAIDAKDQVTHGHIRRVQRYAVELAERIGVKDGSLLKAIEAAALLHDMGKLAVPEHILNKPGKLTLAEFEKMKLHASVGADILSSIEFPYPVVPIVRHHHESWDGTGYPDGLKGTEIPIGARILSVVDCFDALTSHRPYRPQLSNAEALEILKSRSGSMYDPLVVETFERVYTELDVERDTLTLGGHRPTGTAPSSSLPSVDAVIASRAAGASDVGMAFSQETASLIRRQLEAVEADAAVLFCYDPKADEIVASLTAGLTAGCLLGIRIPVGQRLSGWVAANRQPIVNSDASLDLCGEAPPPGVPLKTCLSVPLVLDGDLLGVVTLYSCNAVGAFTSGHVRTLEDASRRIAFALAALDHAPARVPLVS